jgi:hypothetical protein
MDRGRPGAQDEYQTAAASGPFARLKPVVMDLSALTRAARGWCDAGVCGRAVTVRVAAVPDTTGLTISLVAGKVAALSGEHMR